MRAQTARQVSRTAAPRAPGAPHSIPSLRLPLVAIVVPFAAFVLLAATRMPMSYDDAFNATLPLNLLRGHGYATNFAGLHPFDPMITSGAAVLAPAVLPMAVFGTDMQWPMLYTAVVCLALYVALLRSLHVHSPPAALATAILVPFMLWQGKNDRIVTGNIIPAPPFGYWYQPLGNMPGMLALALAMSLLLEPRPATMNRRIAIVALVVFAVNAKLMHLVPLTAMLLTWAAVPVEAGTAAAMETPPARRVAIAVALLAVGACGAWLNRALAWMVLDAPTFETFAVAETAFLQAHNPVAPLLASPLPALPGLMAGSIVRNARTALAFLGGAPRATALVVGLLALALLAAPRARTRSTARLALIFVVTTVVHLLWWIGLVSPVTNYLTPVPVLVCFAMGCGFGLWWETVHGSRAWTYRRAHAAWAVPLLLICAVSTLPLARTIGNWRVLSEDRDHQLRAAAALDRLAAAYPDAAFCAPGWWVPRELTYLAAAGTRYCDVNEVGAAAPGRRILMRASNLWPVELDDVRAAAARCSARVAQIGRFELLGCDGFQP